MGAVHCDPAAGEYYMFISRANVLFLLIGFSLKSLHSCVFIGFFFLESEVCNFCNSSSYLITFISYCCLYICMNLKCFIVVND